MSTLSERLEIALARRSKAKGEEWNPYTLAKESSVTYAHVTRLVGRSDAGATRGKRVGADVIRKLAKALDVNEGWLAYGDGPIDRAPAQSVEKDDRYPNRAVAAGHAREGGVSRAAVESVLADELDSDEDHPVVWWIDRMRMREHMLATRSLPGTSVAADEIPAPRGPRKRTGT